MCQNLGICVSYMQLSAASEILTSRDSRKREVDKIWTDRRSVYQALICLPRPKSTARPVQQHRRLPGKSSATPPACRAFRHQDAPNPLRWL